MSSLDLEYCVNEKIKDIGAYFALRLAGVLHLNLFSSKIFRLPISDIIKERKVVRAKYEVSSMLTALIVALLLAIFLGMALFGFWIWMLVDSIANKKLTDTQRAIWALVIIITGLIGAIVYFFVSRSSQVSQPRILYTQRHRQTVEAQRPYQEGYQPQEISYSARSEYVPPFPAPAEEIPQGTQYEQMQISYPEEK